MENKPKRNYEPSRAVVNAGVLMGGAVGLVLTIALELESTQGFLLTGLCALLGVALLGYGEVFVIRRPRG